MGDLDDLIMKFTAALLEQDFVAAEELLTKENADVTDPDRAQVVLLLFVHLYSNPLNRNLQLAEQYLIKREELLHSSDSALSNAYFYFYSKEDFTSARSWAQAAMQRLREELEAGNAIEPAELELSAVTLLGLSAEREHDTSGLLHSLDLLSAFAQREGADMASSVPLLEAAVRSGGAAALKARRILPVAVSKTLDIECKERALRLLT